MNRFSNLPKLMVAPNGARKSRKDHPNLPITISEIVQEAKNCFQKGANAIHAHVRDQEGNHSLDIGLYKELIKEFLPLKGSIALVSKVASKNFINSDIKVKIVENYLSYDFKKIINNVSPDYVLVGASAKESIEKKITLKKH